MCLHPCPFACFQVAPIVEQVKQRGDAAVKEYTSKFDRVELDKVCVPIEVGVHLHCTFKAGLLRPAAMLHHLGVPEAQTKGL
eukprot:1158990-Pelagomonas_calceolata.AAC.6